MPKADGDTRSKIAAEGGAIARGLGQRPVETGSPAAALRILVVEDDAFIRAATAHCLARLGYTVFEARDAASAMAVLNGREADVLLTDVGLPGQSGIELALHCRDRFPGIKVILATGYSRPLDGLAASRLSDAIILTKPYKIETLTNALRSLAPGLLG